MKKLSMSAEQGSYTRAEMKAYAAGIALAAENMEKVLKNLFIDTAENDGLALFLSMINENPANTADESRQLIIDSVSKQMQIYKKSEFDSLVASLGIFGESTYVTDGNIITLYYTGLIGMPCFKDVSDLCANHIPCFTQISMGSEGIEFLAWDKLALPWFKLDSVKLPFYVLDSM
ncbi:MAG: hypothetical protein K2G22_04545 [Eubacterium sp.]|nr:hypothetical protein [Eubacterium sp.]